MNELQRMAYLQALGVDSYISRRPLPGAASSRRLAIVRAGTRDDTALASAAADAVAGNAAREPAGAAVAGRPVAASGTGAEPVPRAVARPSTGPPATPDLPQQAVCQFSLTAIVAGGALWLENLGAMPLRTEQFRLVRAMAHALAFAPGGAAIQEAQVMRFEWPLHRNRQLDRGEGAARDAVTAFLQRQVHEHTCRGVVLLGENCEHWVSAKSLEVPVVAVPGSAAILIRPELKPQVWQQLQALRRDRR